MQQLCTNLWDYEFCIRLIKSATKIYSQNCDEYGVKKVRKGEGAYKCPVEPETLQAISLNLKKASDNKLSRMVEDFENLACLGVKDLSTSLSIKSESSLFVRDTFKKPADLSKVPMKRLQAMSNMAFVYNYINEIASNNRTESASAE